MPPRLPPKCGPQTLPAPGPVSVSSNAPSPQTAKKLFAAETDGIVDAGGAKASAGSV